MVLIHVKHATESQFLIGTKLDATIEQLLEEVVAVYNGRLKVNRICGEIEELSKHGTLLPPEMLGLTEEQVVELKLTDPWGEKCIPSGGFDLSKDPVGRRNGRRPKKEMRDVLQSTIERARESISKKLVEAGKQLTAKDVQKAVDLLKGAVSIVYPMKLPPHDVIRMEFENVEDLTGTQASLEVMDPATAQLWFCGKEVRRGEGLMVRDVVGKIDNCKVVMKLSKKGQGPPCREPVMSEEERKEWMLRAYRKQEELKKLDADDDDSYLNSEWADGDNLKRAFHGLQNISWRPGKRL